MKALSLWQPWAWLVITGRKRFETRSWGTPYRGPLVIHAAKHWDAELLSLCSKNPAIRHALSEAGRHAGDLPRGAFLGTVQVTAMYRCGPNVLTNGPALKPFEVHCGDYRPGRYAWALSEAGAFNVPIDGGGKQGLFAPPPQVLAQVRGVRLAPTPDAQPTTLVRVEALTPSLFPPGCAGEPCSADAVAMLRLDIAGHEPRRWPYCHGCLNAKLKIYGLDASAKVVKRYAAQPGERTHAGA